MFASVKHIMSMKQKAEHLQRMVKPNNDSAVEEEDDVGALINKEIQLRKAEAAVAAAKSASTHRRTSTRKRPPVINQAKE